MSDQIGVLSEQEAARIAREELNEDPARVKTDIKHIQDWVKTQPHLNKYIKADDYLVLHFLRGCKFSLQKTKEKLDTFYSCRAACPEWFEDIDPKEPLMMELLERGLAVPLLGFDKHGRRVMLMNSNTDPAKHTFHDQLRFTFMVSELLLHKEPDQASITGIVAVSDLGGVTFAHTRQVSPSWAKKALTIMQEGFPDRPKGLHYLNMPGIFESIIKMVLSFVKDKMRSRIHIHSKGDYSKLHEALGKDVLPKEYGGTNGTLQDHIDALKEDVMKNRKTIIEFSKQKANEKNRPGLPKSHSDLFGMEGAFRQLDID